MSPDRRQSEKSRHDASAAQRETARAAAERGEPERCGFDPLDSSGHAVSRRRPPRIPCDRTNSRSHLSNSQPPRTGCDRRSGAAGRENFALRSAARLLPDCPAGAGRAVRRTRLLLGDPRSGPAQSEPRFPLLHGRRVKCRHFRLRLSRGRTRKRDPLLRRTGPAGRCDLRPRTHPSGACGAGRRAV